MLALGSWSFFQAKGQARRAKEHVCMPQCNVFIYIYIIYTPILASSASVLGCEREQGRFKQAREGAFDLINLFLFDVIDFTCLQT
jgi:hypothetical protein